MDVKNAAAALLSPGRETVAGISRENCCIIASPGIRARFCLHWIFPSARITRKHRAQTSPFSTHSPPRRQQRRELPWWRLFMNKRV